MTRPHAFSSRLLLLSRCCSKCHGKCVTILFLRTLLERQTPFALPLNHGTRPTRKFTEVLIGRHLAAGSTFIHHLTDRNLTRADKCSSTQFRRHLISATYISPTTCTLHGFAETCRNSQRKAIKHTPIKQCSAFWSAFSTSILLTSSRRKYLDTSQARGIRDPTATARSISGSNLQELLCSISHSSS